MGSCAGRKVAFGGLGCTWHEASASKGAAGSLSLFCLHSHQVQFCGVYISALDLTVGRSILWAGHPKNDFLCVIWADSVNIQPCCIQYKENLTLPAGFLLLEGCCLQGSPAECCFSLLRRHLLPLDPGDHTQHSSINPQSVPLTAWKMRKTDITWFKKKKSSKFNQEGAKTVLFGMLMAQLIY